MDRDFDAASPCAGLGIFGFSLPPEEAAVVLVAAPWEATTSYGRGTAGAPAAIVRASWQIDLFDADTGRPYEGGIALAEPPPEVLGWSAEASAKALRVIEATEREHEDDEIAALRAEVDRLSAAFNAWVRGEVERWLGRDKLVGLVGGDHSVAFGAIAAHAGRTAELGILQIDAHADLRHRFMGFSDSHASVMDKVLHELPSVTKLVQVGVRDYCEQEHEAIAGSGGRIVTLLDCDLARRTLGGEPFLALAEQAAGCLPRDVYISLDVDGLDPSLCPHTGTPVPGGLSFHQAVALLAAVRQSGRRIVGFDVCEVGPGPAGQEWDANVGARLLYKLIGYARLTG